MILTTIKMLLQLLVKKHIQLGNYETVQDQILSIRNAKIEQKKLFEDELVNRTVDTEVVATRNLGPANVSESIVGWYDPLAQSFLVDAQTDPQGVKSAMYSSVPKMTVIHQLECRSEPWIMVSLQIDYQVLIYPRMLILLLMDL